MVIIGKMMENGCGFVRNNGKCLETVRALHRTVVALRSALEESKNEILELKSKVWPIDSLQDTIKCLSIENHTLKNQLSDKNEEPTKQNQPKIRLCSNIKIRRSRRNNKCKSLDNLPKKKRKLKIHKTISLGKMDETKIDEQDLLDQDQEVDDIELIFTTDETKESDFKEQLVSIEDTNNLQGRDLENSDDRELDDDVFTSDSLRRENSQLFNSKSDNSINHEEKSLRSCYSYQDSSFENKSLEKDESFDRFEEKIRIVETDISKCGIQDVDYSVCRRNTCPNPLQYRPLVHREAFTSKCRKTRPILNYSSAIRKESGAQTDISALPTSSWLSESNLTNEAKTKLSHHFPTLPSKFPLPDGSTKLRLSEKTVEARRVLLSDIGFTSMVPELSRSADHLYPNNNQKPVVTYGQYLRTTDFQQSPGITSQKFTWTTTATSSDQDSCSQSCYNSMYPLLSPTLAASQPHSSRRCSAPVSPSKRVILRPSNTILGCNSKLRFVNGSLPELRSRDWTFLDNSDSTDSLVEEAETYLRRSIDCVVSRSRPPPRRASAPDSSNDNVPPQGWQPFLPRIARDLKLDYWVKVISSEGKVKGGRIRYIGPLMGQSDQFIGVQLGNPDGSSDGSYSNRRYFQCEPYHGIFVPFKKVIMGWRP